MELTGDFKQGFVDTVRADTKERDPFQRRRARKRSTRTRRSSTRAPIPPARAAPNIPSAPPLWRLRAAEDHPQEQRADALLRRTRPSSFTASDRVSALPVHGRSERDAAIGLPGAENQSTRSTTGFGFGTPYFWVISPNMDMTITPSYLSQAGLSRRHRIPSPARKRLLLHPGAPASISRTTAFSPPSPMAPAT